MARGVVAIALLVGGMFGAIALFYVVGVWIDGLIRPDANEGAASITPISLASGLAATALLTPWSMVLQRWLYGVPGPSLHSVVSRIRFGVIGRSILFVVPLFATALAVTELLDPRAQAVWPQADVIGLFLVVILLVPFQASAEEYGVRGLVFRIAGSWVHARWGSLVVGLAVSSAVFALIHTAGDPWWNVFYVLFSLVAGFVTWRTGGVEVAAVIHSVYNVLTFAYWFVLQADLADRLDRSAGTVTPALLVPSAVVLLIIAAAVWMRTRTSGAATTPRSPQADEVALE